MKHTVAEFPKGALALVHSLVTSPNCEVYALVPIGCLLIKLSVSSKAKVMGVSTVKTWTLSG